MIAARDRAATTPPSVRRAFMQQPRRVGGIVLRPLCLGALFALEEIEHPLLAENADTAPLDALSLIHAVFIIAEAQAACAAIDQGRGDFERCALAFSRVLSLDNLPSLRAAVKETVRRALETVPNAGGKSPETNVWGPEKTSGLGWTLTLLDVLLSEYGWPMEFVLFRLPISQAFALHTAVAARYGVESSGPTYTHLAMLDAKRKVEAEWEARSSASPSRSHRSTVASPLSTSRDG